MRARSGLIAAAVVVAVMGMPLAAAVAAPGVPQPGPTPSPGTAGISVVIPGPSQNTASPSPSPSPSSSPGRGGGESTPTPEPSSTPPATCATTDADGAPGAPVVPNSPSTDAAEADVQPDRASPGDRVVIRADGFQPGEPVQAVLYSSGVVLESAAAAADGTVEASLTVPDDTSVGAHTVELTGWTSCVVANGGLFIVSAAGAGASMFPWIVWVVVGAGLVFAAILFFAARLLGWLPFLRPTVPSPGGVG